tara:strand:- start:2023 stop:2241 length:219 start_codon:yes stop_codon:yes gene_type:complete
MTKQELREAILEASATAEGRREVMEDLLDEHFTGDDLAKMEKCEALTLDRVIQAWIDCLDEVCNDHAHDAWC